jgi:hypothetical protein
MAGGRPTTYSEELGRQICDAIAASQDGLRKTLEANPELPAFGTVQHWVRNNAQFSGMFAQAKRQQIEAMAEDIVDISRDDSLEPNDKRIRVDTLKWLLSKLIPKTYGDKIDVTSGGEALATPSHLIDARVQSIIMQAQQRRLGVNDIELPPEAIELLR